jgi:hypothetical protein
MGQITAFDFGGGPWNKDGTFRLKLTDGTRPGSYVAGRGISLRSLIGTGYTYFSTHVVSAPGVTAPGVHGFTVIGDQFDWGLSPTPTSSWIAISQDAAVTGATFDGANWTEDGVFRIKLTDGSRPGSYVTDRSISLREIVPSPLEIPYNGTPGSADLYVTDDSGPWDWLNYVHGFSSSDVLGPNQYGSSTFTISWLPENLTPGEVGAGVIDVGPSDGSSPLSTVEITASIAAAGCCVGRVGDANGSGNDEPTIGDVTVMIDALFIGNDWSVIACLAEADVNQSGGSDPQGGPTGDITIGDISYLIDYLFVTGETIGLPDCL